jgi:hypothetical protein
MGREWNNDDLREYVGLFKERERENVLQQILESELLGKFLATTEGRLILDNVVDGITAQTMKIVSLSASGKNVDEIIDAARKISIAYEFMYGIATKATQGGDHVEAIKKRKTRRE